MASLYHIVSVEDDGGIFALIEATLRPLPVKCHHARNGEEALKIIPALKPDVVLLDIALPDIVGWDLLDQLETLESCPYDIVVLSALVEGGRPLQSNRGTFERVITKPFVPAELRHSVSELLGLA